MTPKERAAMQQVVDAWDSPDGSLSDVADAITALREALDHSGEANERVLTGLKISNKHGKLEFEPVYSEPVNRPQNCGTGYCSCIECPYEAEQAEQKPLCNQHPDAPHGFARNASHNAGRYVCECEGWEPEQAEQEPVAYAAMINGEIAWDADYPFSNEPFTCFDDEQAVPLYAAPVRTKDLTDDDIFKTNKTELPDCQDLVDFARAVIAADRRKNK